MSETRMDGGLPQIKGFWYVATPYSKYAKGIEAAFVDASRIMGVLVRAGYSVFSPIVHTHPIAMLSGMDPLDHAFWLKFDEDMMDAAGGLVVAKMPGWDESAGIAIEVERFKAAGKPIEYINIEVAKAPEKSEAA